MYAGHFDFTKPLFWTVPSLYSVEECGEILAAAASGPWLAATVNREGGRKVDERVRNNTVAILRDPALAASAFDRVRPHVPASMSTEIDATRTELEVSGVHVPLRIYRYELDQFFGVHEDQSYFADDGSQSLLTFMVYLTRASTAERRSSSITTRSSCRGPARRSSSSTACFTPASR